ncbi:hypothetical protein J6590_022876 [Homalodisca vitripennis]|nr:hypothetical protein J6590_022876 [Homalodisca vitripennis]
MRPTPDILAALCEQQVQCFCDFIDCHHQTVSPQVVAWVSDSHNHMYLYFLVASRLGERGIKFFPLWNVDQFLCQNTVSRSWGGARASPSSTGFSHSLEPGSSKLPTIGTCLMGSHVRNALVIEQKGRRHQVPVLQHRCGVPHYRSLIRSYTCCGHASGSSLLTLPLLNMPTHCFSQTATVYRKGAQVSAVVGSLFS